MKIENFEVRQHDLLCSSDVAKLDINYIHKNLLKQYWAVNIPLERLQKSMANSICYGLYKDGSQIGFARVVTDYSQEALLTDVFIDEKHQRSGYGKFLVRCILESSITKDCHRWLLLTKDAHHFYNKFGFNNSDFAMFKLLDSGF